MKGTGCEKCYKLSRCFEQRGRCAEYRNIEEIRQEVQALMRSFKPSPSTVQQTEGAAGAGDAEGMRFTGE